MRRTKREHVAYLKRTQRDIDSYAKRVSKEAHIPVWRLNTWSRRIKDAANFMEKGK